jgi:RND family efflux transporter MFP subunit
MQPSIQKVFDPYNIFKISTLCISIALVGCHKQEEKVTTVDPKNQPLELIQKDVIPVQSGIAQNKVAFSGTIRAVNQSSIQAQVTATATNVQAQVGQSVSKGQILVELNNQDNSARLAQSKANLASTQAQAQQASNMVQRKKRLYNQGFISKVEYEQAQVDYQAQIENVKAQQANVDIAIKANQDGIIRSPISGVITKRQVEPGQTVSMGQTIFEIVDPSQLEIQAKLPTDQQASLKIGNQIEYTIQGNNQKLTASISRISPVADLASRQIEFFAKPNGTINSLSIGAFVDGNILDSKQIQGQLIPLDTIQDISNKPYVWVVRDKKLKQIFINIIEQQTTNNLAVVSGLESQDLISRIKFSSDDINKAVSISAQ